jgi:hypothetical protein
MEANSNNAERSAAEGQETGEPDPRADYFRRPPLPAAVLPNHGEDLGQLQGPMLLMQRGAELPCELDLARRS